MKKDELIFLAIAVAALGASLSYEVTTKRWDPSQSADSSIETAAQAQVTDAPAAPASTAH